MFVETPLPFGDVLCAFCLLIVLYVCGRFYLRVVTNRVNGFDCFLVGFAVFQLLDIVRYQLLDYHERGLTVATQLEVVWLFFSCFVIFLVSYRYSPASKSKAKVAIPIDPSSLALVMNLVLPVTLALIPLHLATFEVQEKSGYLSLIGHGLKGLVVVLFALYCITKRKILLVASILGVVVSLTDSSRRGIIIVILPIILLYVDSIHDGLKQKKTLLPITIAVMFGLLFIYMNYMRADHDFGFGYVEGDALQNTLTYIRTLKSIDTFYNTGFLLENIPDNFDYYQGSTYAALFVSPIPREIWPDKPYGLGAPLGYMQMFLSANFDFDRWVDAGMYSLSPGFLGESYANFGVTGTLILSAITGILLKNFDSRQFPEHSLPGGQVRFLWQNRLPYVVLLPALLLFGRGDFYSAGIYTVYMFVFIKSLLWLFGLFAKR